MDTRSLLLLCTYSFNNINFTVTFRVRIYRNPVDGNKQCNCIIIVYCSLISDGTPSRTMLCYYYCSNAHTSILDIIYHMM